jgi:hypothetical protein
VDRIVLDKDIFVGLWAGDMPDPAFQVAAGTMAFNTSARIVYNPVTGNLIYDRDGSGTQFKSGAFAHVGSTLELSAADFLIV